MNLDNLNAGAVTGNHVGDLVGWSMHDVKKPVTYIKGLAKRFGLEDDFSFPVLSPTSAYRRAVRKVTTKGRHDNRKYVAVRLVDDEHLVAHAIVRADVVDNHNTETVQGELVARDAEFETAVKIGMDKDKKGSWVDDPTELLIVSQQHPVLDNIITEYRDLVGMYTSDDIRAGFQKAFENWAGVRVLSHGGLWLILDENSEKVRQWKSFMHAIDATALVIPVNDSEEAMESLRTVARDSLDDQLADLKLGLRRIADNTRLSTMEKRLEDFSTLRNRARLYEKVLGAEIRELVESVEQAEVELSNKILRKGA